MLRVIRLFFYLRTQLIIQNFNVKYRKTLVKYVLARINDYSSAMQIIKDINILMAIRWAQEAMERSNRDDNENCF